MKENNTLKLVNKDGIETEYEILCAFHLDTTDKYYLIYTDNEKNKKNELNVYASIFDPEDDSVFEQIKTKEEWDMIEKVLNNFQEEK